jgi:hypothetical protein
MKLYFIVDKDTNQLIRGPYDSHKTCQDVLDTGFEAWREHGKIVYTEVQITDSIE